MAALRIEYFQDARGDARGLDLGGVTLAVTGTATSGGSRPVVPAAVSTGAIVAVFTSDAPVYVDVGAAPNPESGQATLIEPGRPIEMVVSAGQLISAITASDIAAGASTPAGSAIIGKVDHTTTGIGHGKKTVTTAGTDVVLASSTAAKWVTIQAYRANTAMIAVGATGVDAAAATGDGVTLAAGESITLPIDNLADLFIDATVNGEGVRYTYGT